MNIAYLVPRLVNQGPIIVVQEIVENLSDKVKCIDIYYFDKEPKEIEFSCNTYQINFFEEFEFNKYDIIHSHMLRPDAYVWYHRKKIKAVCISTIHQDIRPNLRFSYNRFISIIFSQIWYFFLKSQDALVLLTKTMKREYSKIMDINKLYFIYNGRNIDTSLDIDSEDLYQIEELKKKYHIIGSVALLTKRKGIDQLVKALVHLPEFALIIVGDGKEKKRLVKLAQKLNIIDRCLFFGYRINGYRYIKYFDIYAMPSISEGFGLTLLESAQIGKPIVCSDIDLFKELYTDKEVVFFKLFDINSLVMAIQKAKLYSLELIANVNDHYIKSYSADVMAENYYDLYKRLLNEKN